VSELEDPVSIMKKIKDLTNVLYGFYKSIWSFYKDKEKGEEESSLEETYLVFQQKYLSKLLEIVSDMPKEIGKRIYFDLIYTLNEIKGELEKLFITLIYGRDVQLPESFNVSLDEALDIPLKAFNELLDLLESQDSPEKFKEKLNEVSRLEGIMDQSELMVMRQIESFKGKEDNFPLLIVFKVVHSLEEIVDKIEDIGNYLSR